MSFFEIELNMQCDELLYRKLKRQLKDRYVKFEYVYYQVVVIYILGYLIDLK